MRLSYRARQILLRTGIVALVVLVVAVLAFFCWFRWLERFVVYTRDEGAILNMEISPQVEDGEKAVPDEEELAVSIYYNEGENAINTSKEMAQLTGYYADAEALEAGIAAVKEQALALPANTPIMLDVKSPKGNFFYTTTLSTHTNPNLDTAAMDDLIATLDKRGAYLIARLPALRDYYFGLEQTSNGLFVTAGTHLWADDDYCYWLDPTQEGTIGYLAQIVTELRGLGFDEVVFDEFRFPDTTNLRFSGDREAAIGEAAKTLVNSCASDKFTVSFVGQATFPLPENYCRLYLKSAAAAQAEAIAQQTGLEKPDIRLVFLTEIHDTRFDAYGVLRPLAAAH